MRVFTAEIYIALFLYAAVTPVEVGAGTTFSSYTYTKAGYQWSRNREECQKSGGDLVSMETADEWEFIKTEIQRKSTDLYDEWHIGLYRNQSTGNWTWVNGKSLTIQRWRPGKPDKNNVALIAKSYPPGTFGLFNSIRADLRRAYICEKTVTKNCSGCWVHPTAPTTTVQVTSSSKPSETHTTPVSSTEEGTPTSFPKEGGSTPRTDSDIPLVLILAVVFGVLFVVLVVLGIFFFKRFHRSRKSQTTKGVEEQRAELGNNHQDNPDETYDTVQQEAAKLLGAPKEDEMQMYAEISDTNNTYATVDKSKKKKPEDKNELYYAELGELDDDTDSAEPEKPAPYTPTVYADVVGTVTDLLNRPSAPQKPSETEYANVA